MFQKELVRVVGFDLDECLYPSVPAINNRIRNKMSEGILARMPDLKSVEEARAFFERRYAELQSGRKVLLEVGYSPEEAGRIADEAVSQADILDLLKPDSKTADLVKRIGERYETALLTSSPREAAIKKLEAIGIKPIWFMYRMYGDTPGIGNKQDGQAFQYMLRLTKQNPDHHVYIGNSRKSDIIPARNARMQTIAVWSEIPEADLSLNHIHELETIFL